jgi:hypothetical protein
MQLVASSPRQPRLKVVGVEPTPNPNAMKFLLNRRVSEATISARTADQAAGNPVTGALFAIPGVAGVMLLGDFVTINKSPEAKWPDIKNAVRQNLLSRESEFNLGNG